MLICNNIVSKVFLTLAFIFTFVGVVSAQGVKHVVAVQGSFPNYVFAPDSLMVNVGDIVEWQGSFGSVGAVGKHTVTATAKDIPAGATPFDNQSGTVFDYPVTVAGNYFYICQNHFNCCGMKGGFLTQASGVQWPTEPAPFELFQTSPNPASNSTEISFNLHSGGTAILNVFDDRGALVAPLLAQHVDAGLHKVNFDTSKLPSGVYFYSLDALGSIVKKQMIVQH
jgi:plastocyanin